MNKQIALRLRIVSAVSIISLLLGNASVVIGKEIQSWTADDYRAAFDEVSRNYGAVEFAIYTFMVEFGRAPNDLDELRNTGHLNVLMVNPYTGGPVISLKPKDIPDGDIAGNFYVAPRDNGREAHVSSYFYRWVPKVHLRSMVKRIYLYQSSIDYALFFENDLPRDEQMTAVYCRQVIDALESFQQKKGYSPQDFVEMYEKGDVNVKYFNPVTNELAVNTCELSAGNYFYEKIGPEGFILIGWGRKQPVFFATTDDKAEADFYAKWPELKPKE